MTRSSWPSGALSLCLLMAVTGPAGAAKLEKPECEALRAEETLLATAGVRADMQRGPEWAKANLAPERLVQVKRLIEIGEQLVFRCDPVRAPVEAKANGETPARAKKRPPARAPGVDEAASSSVIGVDLGAPDATPAPKATAKKKASRKSKRQSAAAPLAGEGQSAGAPKAQ